MNVLEQAPQPVDQAAINAQFEAMTAGIVPQEVSEQQVALDSIQVSVVMARTGVAGVPLHGPMAFKFNAEGPATVINVAPKAEDVLVEGTAATIGSQWAAYKARQAQGVDAQIYHAQFDKSDTKKKEDKKAA